MAVAVISRAPQLQQNVACADVCDTLELPNSRLSQPSRQNGKLTDGVLSKPHKNGVVCNGTTPLQRNGHLNGVPAVIPRPLPPAVSTNDCVVIREVYENGLASEFFELQLDYALDAGVRAIVIEPSALGRETSQWLRIGNGLRRSALAVWSASLLAGALRFDRTCAISASVAGAMAAVYAVSWRPDPCSKYRVETNSRQLQRLPLHNVACSTPVVLVRREQSAVRRGVYSSVVLATVAVSAWRLSR